MKELVLADAAAAFERDAQAFEAWGQKLTLEEFRRREVRLRGTAWARTGMRTWLLVEDGATLSSCETFRMESVLRGEPGSTHGVASVFTEPALRSRGHASALMALVLARLRSEPGSQASILFSDVGPDLYRRAGWQPVPGVDRLFDPAPGDPAEVAELVDEAHLAAALAALPPQGRAFEVRPTAAQLDWHLERERAYADLLGAPRPRFHGARAGGSLLLWCGGLKTGELLGLLYRAADLESGAAVIEAACREAARAGLARVGIWERGEAQPFPAHGRRIVRRDSLPMIAPIAPGLAATDFVDTDRALWI